MTITESDLIAEAREALALFDKTPGVKIEIYYGMNAAKDAYCNAPALIRRLVDALERER